MTNNTMTNFICPVCKSNVPDSEAEKCPICKSEIKGIIQVKKEIEHKKEMSSTQEKSNAKVLEIVFITCGFIVCGIIGGIIGGFIGNIGGGFIGVFIGFLVFFICLLTEAECCVFC